MFLLCLEVVSMKYYFTGGFRVKDGKILNQNEQKSRC